MLQRSYMVAGCIAGLIVAGCSPASDADLIGQDPGVAQSFETKPELLRELQTIPHHLAEGVSGPNGVPFFIHDRSTLITQFPCTSCHTTIPESESSQVQSRTMHQDIVIKHADESVMNCSTCHDSQNPNELRLLGGDTLSMRAVYKQCAQCHSQQATDWAGGAHGKRLVGWQGRRVINTCTDCHNPHSPAIPHKQPGPGPRFAHER